MKRIKRHSWTVTFISKGGIHQFVIKNIYVYVISALTFIVFIGSLSFAFRENKKHSMYMKLKFQQNLRRNYLKTLDELNRELKTLKTKINLAASYDDRLRYVVDVEPLNRELRIKGIGGPSSIDTFRDKLSKPSLAVVGDLLNESAYTENLLNLEKSSYEDIYKRLTATIDLKKHTPSIWPTQGYISSRFGWRIHPIRRTPEFHKGLDIANLPGTPVYATADGVVDYAGRMGGYGRYVSIDHGYGFKTKYGHLRGILVKVGQKVKRGDLIATMGRSGLATGPHLHYEVRVLNKPVNPLGYIIKDTLTY